MIGHDLTLKHTYDPKKTCDHQAILSRPTVLQKSKRLLSHIGQIPHPTLPSSSFFVILFGCSWPRLADVQLIRGFLVMGDFIGSEESLGVFCSDLRILTNS